MIHVTIDPELARERYGLMGELAARAASGAIGNALEAGAPATRTKATGDVFLGVVILAALGAVAYWNHIEGKRRRR